MKKAKAILGHMRQEVSGGDREVLMSLEKAIVKSQNILFWSPMFKTGELKQAPISK